MGADPIMFCQLHRFVCQCAPPRLVTAVHKEKLAFLRALNKFFIPKLANIASLVEITLAKFPSCHTVALVTTRRLSSLIEDCIAWRVPTTRSKMGVGYHILPFNFCSVALFLLEFEGTISQALLLPCQPLLLVNCHVVFYAMCPLARESRPSIWEFFLPMGTHLFFYQ